MLLFRNALDLGRVALSLVTSNIVYFLWSKNRQKISQVPDFSGGRIKSTWFNQTLLIDIDVNHTPI